MSARVALALAATTAVSAGLTALSIGYARRRQLLDMPGRRRSHVLPTPRGGGIGFVATLGAATLLYWPIRNQAWALAAAMMLVGLVGWIDDHRGLAARWRLLAHVLAVALVLSGPAMQLSAGLCALSSAEACLRIPWYVTALALLVGLALTWSINLHNFMDGINGILGMQAVFMFGTTAFVLWQPGNAHAAMAAAVCAAAVLGFLPFNFPHARVFMGDVGSGVLGLLIGLCILELALHPGIAAGSGLIAASAFVTDASCTLGSRLLRGRRWYSAHREHLYQWLVRSGFSHAQVVALYMGWNGLIVLPTLLWINRPIATSAGIVQTVAVYVLAIVVWWYGKRWCLQRVATGESHAAT